MRFRSEVEQRCESRTELQGAAVVIDPGCAGLPFLPSQKLESHFTTKNMEGTWESGLQNVALN